MGDFKVNFGALEQAAADIRNSGKALKGRLDELDQQLAPLRSDWTGAASESYQQARARWNTAIADMNQLLDDIGAAVGGSHTEYDAAEKGNQQRW